MKSIFALFLFTISIAWCGKSMQVGDSVTMDTTVRWGVAGAKFHSLYLTDDSTWWRHSLRFNYDTGAETIFNTWDEKTNRLVCMKMKGGHMLTDDSLFTKKYVEDLLNVTINDKQFSDRMNWIKDSLYYEWQWSNQHKHHNIGVCK